MKQIYQAIEVIRKRLGMYLGELSISKLETFLNGYRMALNDLEEKAYAIFPLPLRFFHDYVAFRYHYSGSSSGWKNMILDQVDHDEGKGLDLFFELLDEFKQIAVDAYYTADLRPNHITYHHTNERLFGYKFGGISEPIYKNPVKIYYAKLSNTIGYIGLIQTDIAYLILHPYRVEEQLQRHFQTYFGEEINWHEIDHIDIDKPVQDFW